MLRDHGHACGAQAPAAAGRRRSTPLPPAVIDRPGTGVSVCLHLTGVQATTAAMIVSLPRRPAPDEPDPGLGRARLALRQRLRPRLPVRSPRRVPPDGRAGLGLLAEPADLAAVRARCATGWSGPGAPTRRPAPTSWSGSRGVAGPGSRTELWAEADDAGRRRPRACATWAAAVWPGSTGLRALGV